MLFVAIRAGHLPFAAESLSVAARDVLQRVRVKETEPETPCISSLQEAVAKASTFLQCHYYSEASSL